jgi:restriction endonuclease S subunit
LGEGEEMSYSVDPIEVLESRVKDIKHQIRELKEKKRILHEEYFKNQAELDNQIKELEREQYRIYGEIDAEKERRFKEKLFEKHGYKLGDPIAEKVYAKAWERGHAYGFNEVENEFDDLIELVR